jgi:Fe-S-cluster-containing dehydrogenase component
MKAFVIDLSVCNGCYACQVACKDEHVANDWTPYAKPQPDTGHFWLKIDEQVRGTVPKVKVSYRPHICMHCGSCISVCPIEGAIYQREDGLVIIDPVKCTGCMKCVDSCAYNAIYFNKHLNIAQKCTGCAHLIDDGWKLPRCADNCPTEAIKFGEESEFAELIAKAEVMKPELGLKPRVYYLNVMKRFIAGTVYDPKEKEVIIGAELLLTDLKTSAEYRMTTDNFGDFWFKGLADSSLYRLKIASNGKEKTIDGISTEKDVNLGDIPLT